MMQTHELQAGDYAHFPSMGLLIHAGYNEPEFGRQPYVTINTEGMPARYLHSGGFPILMVDLNQSELYDDEGDGDKVRGAEAAALDAIHRVLTDGPWNDAALALIAAVLTSTGRITSAPRRTT